MTTRDVDDSTPVTSAASRVRGERHPFLGSLSGRFPLRDVQKVPSTTELGARTADEISGRVIRRALLASEFPEFSTVVTTGDAASGDGKYSGSAAVGASIIFAPSRQNNVGVLDTTSNLFTTVNTTGSAASGDYKYAGAVAVGSKVYFTPCNQNNVGMFDTATKTFSIVVATGKDVSGDFKYRGAALVGTKVYFGPFMQDNVGVLDTATNVFTTIATTGAAASGSAKYGGAVALGTNVYFVPSYQTNVGVLDTSADTFSTISVSGYGGYMGGAAVGTNIYFTPFRASTPSQSNVGVLDTSTKVFTTISTALSDTTAACCSDSFRYNGAAAVGKTVYFAPYNHNSTGVLDTVTNVFSTIPTKGDAAFGLSKYAGATAVGAKVFFVPSAQHNVGTLQTYVTTWEQVVAMYDGGSTLIEIHGDMQVASTLTITRDVVFVGKCVPGPCTLTGSNTRRHFLLSSCVVDECAVSFSSLHFANGYSSSSGGYVSHVHARVVILSRLRTVKKKLLLASIQRLKDQPGFSAT